MKRSGTSNARLSSAFAALAALAEGGDPTLGALVAEMGRRGHAMVILFLTLPFSLPLPVWGLSTPFGIAVALTALHMMLAGRLWLPRRIAARPVPAATVRAIAQAAQRLLARTECYIRPRGRFFHAHPGMVRFNALLMFLAGVFLALPLPIPGTNLAPSWLILFICVGTLEEDGLLVVLGYCAFAVGVAIAWLLLWPLLNWEHVRGWLKV
jgi:hypothetical protein